MLRHVFTTVTNPRYRPTALRVALCVGSVLFVINHGHALVTGQMTFGRWLSAALTYCVPYGVSLHGQWRGDRAQCTAQGDRALHTVNGDRTRDLES
ncbi:MAG: nitrate/nitrite transporter NrtS [Cyanobacteria bacterium P01_G01_bin.54]